MIGFGIGRKTARGLCPLDPRWGLEAPDPHVLKARRREAIASLRLAFKKMPVQGGFALVGVWGQSPRPSLGQS